MIAFFYFEYFHCISNKSQSVKMRVYCCQSSMRHKIKKSKEKGKERKGGRKEEERGQPKSKRLKAERKGGGK